MLAKVVYHKLLDPDHKKLRTLVVDGNLKHINNGYCSLLEPISIAKAAVRPVDRRPQPGHVRGGPLHQADRLYVRWPAQKRALHRPARARRAGRGPDLGFDPVAADLQLRRPARSGFRHSHLVGSRPTIFRAMSSRKFSSALTTASGTATAASGASSARSPVKRRSNARSRINNHYNGTFLEPWNERSQRGYGVEVLERFAREVAMVEFGGPNERARRADWQPPPPPLITI